MSKSKKRRSKRSQSFAWWTLCLVIIMFSAHIMVFTRNGIYLKGTFSLSQRIHIAPEVYINPARNNHEHFLNHVHSSTSVNNASRKRSHIMLFGYMRGGTTFLGEVLGLRKDTIYFYEPFLGMTVFDFFGSNQVCNQWSAKCRNEANNEISTALDYLEQIYKCDFSNMLTMDVLNQVAQGRRLQNWTYLEECRNINTNACPRFITHSPHFSTDFTCRRAQSYCMYELEKTCRSSSTVFTKVLRLRMNHTRWLLDRDPEFKVIHLIRDPRAVMYSRIKIWTNLCPNIHACASSLCDKMVDDFKDFQELKKLYPNRTFSIYYDKLVVAPFKLSKQLYLFLGYNYTRRDEKHIDLMTKPKPKLRFNTTVWSTLRADNSITASRRWRRTIRPIHLQAINDACYKVYKLYGFKVFSDKSEVQNMQISSLENIKNNKQYTKT